MKEIVSKIRLILSINLSIVMLLSGLVVSTISVNAATCDINGQVGIDDGADCAKGNKVADNLAGQGGIFQTIVNILLFLVGAVAVIMLVIGGLRYVTSNGDQNAVTGAKNTIMYAIIGIVVAFLAYAAVNFVITQLQVGTEST
jgi:hypothetical protein